MTLQAKVEASGLSGRDTALEVLSALGLLDAVIISPPESGGPCYVVTREAMRVAAVAACDEFNLACDDHDIDNAWDRCVLAALAALLDNVRVAVEVVRLDATVAYRVNSENVFDAHLHDALELAMLEPNGVAEMALVTNETIEIGADVKQVFADREGRAADAEEIRRTRG